MTLRDEIASEIEKSFHTSFGIESSEAAGRILAIPKIAAALKLLDEQERLNLGHGVKLK